MSPFTLTVTQPTAALPLCLWPPYTWESVWSLTWGITSEYSCSVWEFPSTHTRTCAHIRTCCQCKMKWIGQVKLRKNHSLLLDWLVQLTKRIHFPDIVNPYRNIVYVYTYVSVLGVSMCHHVLCSSDAPACGLPGFSWSVCSRPGGATASFPQPVCRALMPCPSKTSTLSTTNDSQPPPQQKHHSNHLRVPGGFAAWQLQFESVAFL